MQYFVASLLALLGLVNSSQCTEVNGGHNTWSSGPRVRLEVHPRIEEWPHSGPGKKLVLHKKNEPLNMTCTVVYQNGEKDDETPFDYTVDWKGPRHVNNNPKIERGQSKNTAWIWFERLAEKDAGDYTCMAISHKPWGHQTSLSVFFYLFVEHKPTYCGSQWFRCRSRNCIMERYVCDGKQDCEEGEDESPAAGCGLDPCLGKVLCEDRCIPPEWCCDHRNCSGTFGLRPWPHENHEISYVQTAFYTVIGCAMAFMFIVTILVIAICRVQIKRAMNSRCSQQNRNVICGRRTVPLYDLDVYLNRTADVNYPGGVSIMYNINSGVQFVGRPTEPPPYSEVIAEPPREGPPPPYVSCENLIVRVANPRFNENTEISTCHDDADPSLPLNRNIAPMPEANPSDTDIRTVLNVNQNENLAPNIPGPQVPTCASLSQLDAIVQRDANPLNFTTRIAGSSSSRDHVDSPIVIAESTRIRRLPNYEDEYVETDALLADNTENCSTSRRDFSDESTTATIAWQPYSRHALAKSRWLNNDRRDKRSDKNWYRQTSDKTIKEYPARETSSHKDSENEGVFLDTDQQDSTPAESSNGSGSGSGSSSSSSSVENDITAGVSSSFAAGIIDTAIATTIVPSIAKITTMTTKTAATSREISDDNFTPSCSNLIVKNNKATDLPRAADNEQVESIISAEDRDDRALRDETTRMPRTELKFLREKKTRNEDERSDKRSRSGRNSLRGIKRQSSLSNEEDTRTKNLSRSYACASTGSVDLPNPRLDDDAVNSQIRQSSLVLPLRESFIGVQRDS